jgi:hypothetical protein
MHEDHSVTLFRVLSTSALALLAGCAGEATSSTQFDPVDSNVPARTTETPPPSRGCTLTQGYWATHSQQGPAPYDNGWLVIGPQQESTPFFGVGQTWLAVLVQPPRGNAYYILAKQYIAGVLNVLNGVSYPPEVSVALFGAYDLWNSLPAGSTALSPAQKTQALAWATTLDQYNNGIIGPGHCE